MRFLVADHGTTWDLLLPHAKFAYNNLVNQSTDHASFEVVTRIKPRASMNFVPLPLTSRVSEGAIDFCKHLQEVH